MTYPEGFDDLKIVNDPKVMFPSRTEEATVFRWSCNGKRKNFFINGLYFSIHCPPLSGVHLEAIRQRRWNICQPFVK